eukprot:m.43623 g.43623  ORF g.43623 m.43623 type:complete len:636 (-) comp9988_c0_seq2:294-2201(-)
MEVYDIEGDIDEPNNWSDDEEHQKEEEWMKSFGDNDHGNHVGEDTSQNAGNDAEGSEMLTRMALATKAGMEGIDKDKANKIIHEASKGSRFFTNQQVRDAQNSEKVNEIKRKLVQIRERKEDKSPSLLKVIDAQISGLERSRDLSRCFVHVDMDMFYAAVEERDNPSLVGKPVGVGGMGMLCTSNYEARQFGVRAAMPGYIAKKLCPHLIIVPTRFSVYRAESKKVKAVLAEYDPNFSAMSLDEAYLDITNYMQQFRDENDESTTYNEIKANEVVEEIRKKIQEATRLTASAGIGPARMIAKICSDYNKPNGQYSITPTKKAVLDFLGPLSVSKISGIGKVTKRMLEAVGVKTCNDILKERVVLSLLFSEKSFNFFLAASLGIQRSSSSGGFFSAGSNRKSMSVERTFRELSRKVDLEEKCLDLCRKLVADLAKGQFGGHTLTLKIKTVDFDVRSRAVSVPHLLSTHDEIVAHALPLLEKEWNSGLPMRLRLMGIRLSSLQKLGQTSQQTKIQVFLSETQAQNVGKKEKVDYKHGHPRHLENGSERDRNLADKGNLVTCPVCSKPISQDLIEQHVDTCLNKQAVREILSQDKRKREHDEERKQSLKKKKSSLKQANIPDTKSKPGKIVTINSFFS